jgi:uncharacterized OB-fold protein
MSTLFHTALPATPTLQLQCCGACNHVSYPSRELCGACLADALSWQSVAAEGTVQSLTTLHYSLESAYADHLPWTIASVRLDCGPIAFAHLQPGVGINTGVTLQTASDRTGSTLLIAVATDGPAVAVSDWLRDIEFSEVSP